MSLPLGFSALAETAVAAAASGDPDGFRAAISELNNEGWDLAEAGITSAFVDVLLSRVGTRPSVGTLVNLSQALYPFTGQVLSASPRQLEAQMRGFLGAPDLLAASPRNVSLAIQLAILGCMEWVVGVELGSDAYDGVA